MTGRRWDPLLDPPTNTLYGSKYVVEYFYVITIDDETYTISGWPDCPVCDDRTIQRQFGLDQWWCPYCNHSWDSESLVNAWRKEGAMSEELTKEERDANAVLAEQELIDAYTRDEADLVYVASWLSRWAHKSSYKRLGRVILRYRGN